MNYITNLDSGEVKSLIEYNSNRQKPSNFRPEDEHLFDKEWERKIPSSRFMELFNVLILEDTLFCPLKLRFYDQLTHPQNLGKAAKIRRLVKLYKPGKTIIKGIWISDLWAHNYFHWITESLTRLLALRGEYTEYTILLPVKLSEYSYIIDSLSYFGYQYQFIKPDKIHLIKHLVSFERTAPSFNFHKDVILALGSHFRAKKNNPNPYRKVYLSRGKAAKRRIINESELIPLLKKSGFEIHDFDTYSFHEQLTLMCETSYLVSIHGAGLTNMLYMRAGANILELRFENDRDNNCFFVLASELGHSYWYTQNSFVNPKIHLNSDMIVDMDLFKATLEDFVKIT